MGEILKYAAFVFLCIPGLFCGMLGIMVNVDEGWGDKHGILLLIISVVLILSGVKTGIELF